MRTTRSRLFVAAVLASCVAACREPALSRVNEQIRVEPAEIDLGVFWLGHAEPLRVRVFNDSRTSVSYRATVQSEEVEAEPYSGTLAAGDSEEIEIVLQPVAVGVLRDTFLVFEAHGPRVAVRGEIRDPLPCDHRETCGVERFAPEADGCEWVPLDDGTACQGPCVVDGTCEAGVCLGQARVCPDDDGDACTEAACDQNMGCTLVPRRCRPSSSCATATCDPAEGCVEEPVQDGTFCGEPNCDQDHVCIVGSCVARTPPDSRPVQRCVRAKSVHVLEDVSGSPGGSDFPVTCTISKQDELVCWGNVRPAFSGECCRRDDRGPWVAGLGPARAIFKAGFPLLIQRPDGDTYYMSVSDKMDDVLKYWGAAGRGLHLLPDLNGIVDATGYRIGMCGVTPDGKLLCGGADFREPPLELYPSQPVLSDSVAGVRGSTRSDPLFVRMNNGGLRWRKTLPTTACPGPIQYYPFTPVSGVPPFGQFEIDDISAAGCGVAPWGDVYCGSCASYFRVPGTHGTKQVRRSGSASCALLDDGDLWCWGRLLPFGEKWDVPRRVEGFEHLVDFDMGTGADWYNEPTICGVRNDGLVKCMGQNFFREAGVFKGADGGIPPRVVSEPTAVTLPDAGIYTPF